MKQLKQLLVLLWYVIGGTITFTAIFGCASFTLLGMFAHDFLYKNLLLFWLSALLVGFVAYLLVFIVVMVKRTTEEEK